jgi:hypothetical protein
MNRGKYEDFDTREEIDYLLDKYSFGCLILSDLLSIFYCGSEGLHISCICQLDTELFWDTIRNRDFIRVYLPAGVETLEEALIQYTFDLIAS